MTSAAEWATRAQAAGNSVNTQFGYRPWGLPHLWLGRVRVPAKPGLEWHYWWQAHYLDALVDSAWRLDAGAARNAAVHHATDLLRGIRVRNFFRLVNSYYDDMAWLALAAGRLYELVEILEPNGPRRGGSAAQSAVRTLGRQLESAATSELGGGLFWSRKRNFKNTPATAPAALFFARTGQPERARNLLDWLAEHLLDPATGLYLDGIKITPSGPVVERGIYSYNQGTVLGALVELGGARELERAATLLTAIAEELTHQGPDGALALDLAGSGDGGLFTGILVRYLSLAARHQGLPVPSRTLAARMVLDTATELWSGRSTEPFLSFAANSGETADGSYPPEAAVELSTQLQAWITFECAHQVAAGGPDLKGNT